MFTLFEGAVSDLAQQADVVVQGANIASVDLLGVRFEMVVAKGCQSRQHRVDLELGCHEGVVGFGIAGGAAGGHGLVSNGELHRFRVLTIALTGWLV
jgi:hypothetical protein